MIARSPEVVNAILEGLADGKSLRTVCKAEGMPHRITFLRWLDDDDDLATRYARAKEVGLDERAEKLEEDIEAEDDVARAKLKFEYGKWYLSKLFPKKYGDKTLVGSDPDNPLPTAIPVLFRDA